MEVKHYKIIKSLKKTSKWELFLARHIQNDKLFVKIRIFNHTLTSNEASRNILLKTLKYLYTIRSSHIVSLLDYGYLDNNIIYQVIEHLDYLNSRELLNKTKRLPQDIAAIIIKEILIGLSQAHSRGIIHGHLKPNLILSSSTGIIKIQDFAYPDNSDSFNYFLCAETPFSDLYFAPEHILKIPLTKRTDIFSLGIIAYEMISGKHPFYCGEKPWDVHKILSDNHEPIFYHLPNINPLLERVIEKMLKKNPDERYENAESALEELEPFIASLGSFKPYEILSIFFIDPKLSAEQIEKISSKELFDIARREFYSKNYKKALFLFQILKKLEANFEGLDIYINDIKENKGLYIHNESAEKLLFDNKSKLEREPNNISVLIKLMKLNKDIGNYLDSIYYSKKILQIDPSNEEAIDNITEFIPSEPKTYEISTNLTKALGNKLHEDRKKEYVQMPLYRKLFIAVIILSFVILLMNYYKWISFEKVLNNALAYPSANNSYKISSEISKIEKNLARESFSIEELNQLIIKLQDLHKEDVELNYACDINSLLSKIYLKLDKFYKTKFYINRTKESCDDYNKIKLLMIEYGNYLESKGNLSLALDNYLELMLNLDYKDKDYRMLEEKVKILQKRILLAIGKGELGIGN